MNEISIVVSNNIKAIRKEKQLTLQELSDKSGVSTSMLGGIERGDTNPTITILNKIAYGFKIPLTKLLEEDKKSFYLVKSKDRLLFKDEKNNKVSTVFKYNEDYGFQILEIDMDEDSQRISQGHNKGVVEFLIVNEGMLKVVFEHKTFELKTGDALRFEADKPHKLVNIGNGKVKATNLIYYNKV